MDLLTTHTGKALKPGGSATALNSSTIGDVFKPNRPRVSPANKPDLPFIGMEHVEAHTMRLLGTVSARTMKSSSVHFQPGDVLYGRLRPYLNKVYRPDFEGLCSAEFIVFPNTPDIDTKYLQYFLNSYDFVSFATHLNEGDRPRVDFKQIAPYPFPLAPLPEQRRIVSAIETQLGRLDAAVARLHAAQAKLKRYKQAVLKAAVEGWFLYPEREEDELPKGWRIASLGELVEDPRYGTSKKCGADPKGIPVLRIPNIGDGIVSQADLKYATFDAEECKAYELRAGDILTIRSNGSVDLVGKCALIREVDEHCLYAGYLIRLRPKRDIAEPRYLLYHLSSLPSRVEIESKAKSTSGVNNINAQELRDLTITLPTLKDQIAICDTVELLMSGMNTLETTLDAELLRSTRLRQAVLKRAFEGRLVKTSSAL